MSIEIQHGDTIKSSPEEEDQLARSTKKVKMNEENQVDHAMGEVIVKANYLKKQNADKDVNQESNQGNVKTNIALRRSYRDMVVDNEFGKLNPYEIVEMVSEEYLPEDPSIKSSLEVSNPFNPNPTIEVSLEEYEDWCRPWKFSLIVKPLENFFLVRLTSQYDYAHVLFEGPWMIADHYLLVQRWRPLFIPQELEVQKVTVWIRIPNLPAELYNKYFLWKVGKMLGTMLKVDDLTSIHSRGCFARLCVEIDLRKKIIPSFTALDKEFHIQYEGLHHICFNCGRYGHRKENCIESMEAVPNKVPPAAMGGGRHGSEEEPNGQEQSLGSEPSQYSQERKEIIKEKNKETSSISTNDLHNQKQESSNSMQDHQGVNADKETNPFGPWMIAKKKSKKE
ncbi:uncharacterized protein LOC107479996 [Arachis duranensis]|uniref:Uncharacterized protein LOC107479996 n=1 Tax=Arachis duranensis TaxID=130453 RepID=A0A6P4CQY0_ARADU|nr:uncharacterized protein LOC107479996 [Arachis duranensis]